MNRFWLRDAYLKTPNFEPSEPANCGVCVYKQGAVSGRRLLLPVVLDRIVWIPSRLNQAQKYAIVSCQLKLLAAAAQSIRRAPIPLLQQNHG